MLLFNCQVINKKAHFNERTLFYFKKVAWSFLYFQKEHLVSFG